MRKRIRGRVKLADVPGAALVTKDPGARHQLAVDHVVESVWRQRHVRRSSLAPDQSRCQCRGEGVLPGPSAGRLLALFGVHAATESPDDFAPLRGAISRCLVLQPVLDVSRQADIDFGEVGLFGHVRQIRI
jgi:hypothetical protein